MFDAMLKSKMSEAKMGCLKLIDFSPEAVGVFIEFLYSDNVASKWWRPIAQELWHLADKYNVRHIKHRVETCSTLIGVGNVHELVQWAEFVRVHAIKDRCIQFLVGHRELLQRGTPVQHFSQALLYEIILAQR